MLEFKYDTQLLIEGEDLDELTEKVVDFLEQNNCTKKLIEKVQKLIKNSQG